MIHREGIRITVEKPDFSIGFSANRTPVLCYWHAIAKQVSYADDTVVFGTDENEFQNNLDMFYEYSELWHLSINCEWPEMYSFQ